MSRRSLVLYDPQTKNEPLFIEFRDNVFLQSEDQIVCEMTESQVKEIVEYSTGTYIEDNIYVPQDVRKYLERK